MQEDLRAQKNAEWFKGSEECRKVCGSRTQEELRTKKNPERF